MLTASCTGFLAYAVLGDAQDTWALWVAVLVAILTGGLISLLHALLTVSYRVDQIISGVVINLLALGLTGFLRSEVLVDTGISTGVPTAAIGLPLLSEIPIVGPQLFTNKPIFFAMFVDHRDHGLGAAPHPVRAAGAVGRRASRMPPRPWASTRSASATARW